MIKSGSTLLLIYVIIMIAIIGMKSIALNTAILDAIQHPEQDSIACYHGELLYKNVERMTYEECVNKIKSN